MNVKRGSNNFILLTSVLWTLLCVVIRTSARTLDKKRQLVAVNAELSTIVQYPSPVDGDCYPLDVSPTNHPTLRHVHSKKKRKEINCLKRFALKQNTEQPFDHHTITGRCPSLWRSRLFSGTTAAGNECIAQIAYRKCSCES